MVARRVFVVDTETTSLIPDYAGGTGTIWELALIERTPGSERQEFLWRMEPDLAKASPQALLVGRYYERTTRMKHKDTLAHDISKTPAARGAGWSNPRALSVLLARMLDDATLIAANPTFDAGFMADMLRAHGQAPTWHYRLRDFGSMAWGYLAGSPLKWSQITTEAVPDVPVLPAIDASTDDFAKALGVNLALYERHTAMGDCRIISAGLDVMEGK